MNIKVCTFWYFGILQICLTYFKIAWMLKILSDLRLNVFSLLFLDWRTKMYSLIGVWPVIVGTQHIFEGVSARTGLSHSFIILRKTRTTKNCAKLYDFYRKKADKKNK